MLSAIALKYTELLDATIDAPWGEEPTLTYMGGTYRWWEFTGAAPFVLVSVPIMRFALMLGKPGYNRSRWWE